MVSGRFPGACECQGEALSIIGGNVERAGCVTLVNIDAVRPVFDFEEGPSEVGFEGPLRASGFCVYKPCSGSAVNDVQPCAEPPEQFQASVFLAARRKAGVKETGPIVNEGAYLAVARICFDDIAATASNPFKDAPAINSGAPPTYRPTAPILLPYAGTHITPATPCRPSFHATSPYIDAFGIPTCQCAPAALLVATNPAVKVFPI